MTGIEQSIGIAILAGITGAGIIGAACALAYPRLRRRLAGIRPTLRLPLLLTILILPLFTGMALVGIILSPILDYGPVTHHCHTLTATGCVPHNLQTLDPIPSLVIVSVITWLALWPLLRLFEPLLRLQRTQTGLRLTASYDASQGVHYLDDLRPLAFSLGLFRPDIFISTGLLGSLNDLELEAVIQHERGHIRRRDALCRLLGQVLSIGHGRNSAARLLSDLHLASEQASDEYASRQIGNRYTMAATILKMERLCAQHFPAPAVAHSMMGSSVPDRIRALIAPPAKDDIGMNATLIATAGGFLLTVFISAEPLHHFIESIL